MFAWFAIPFYVTLFLGVQILVVLLEAVRGLFRRLEPDPASRFARLQRWADERDDAL